MKAGKEGQLGEERRQRILDMWAAFRAEQLQLQKVGSMEYLRKRLRGPSKRFLGFVPPKRLVCYVQRHHAIDSKQMEIAIRDMLMMTEVPAAL